MERRHDPPTDRLADLPDALAVLAVGLGQGPVPATDAGGVGRVGPAVPDGDLVYEAIPAEPATR